VWVVLFADSRRSTGGVAACSQSFNTDRLVQIISWGAARVSESELFVASIDAQSESMIYFHEEIHAVDVYVC